METDEILYNRIGRQMREGISVLSLIRKPWRKGSMCALWIGQGPWQRAKKKFATQTLPSSDLDEKALPFESVSSKLATLWRVGRTLLGLNSSANSGAKTPRKITVKLE